MKCRETGYSAIDCENFEGHVFPGLAIFVFGLLWAYNSLFRYHVARHEAFLSGGDVKKLNYRNSLFSKYHTGYGQRAPVEAYAVVCVTISSIIVLVVSYAVGYTGPESIHHIFIHFFYSLLAITVILKHRKTSLPPDADYVMFAVANVVQGFILSNHLSGRTGMDQQVHMTLAYLNALTLLCVVFEMIYRHSVTVALGRTISYAAQGLWLCVAGSILHPLPFMPQWDQEDHWQMDVVTSITIGIIAIILVVVFAFNLIISRRVESMGIAAVSHTMALLNERGRSPSKANIHYHLISDADI